MDTFKTVAELQNEIKLLTDVGKAREAVETAETGLDGAMAKARRDGLTLARIGEAAGLDWRTVKRRIAEVAPEDQPLPGLENDQAEQVEKRRGARYGGAGRYGR